MNYCPKCQKSFVSHECPDCGDIFYKTEAERRKGIPVYSGFIKYFPRAILAVARLSKVANDQHNPGEPLHWAKEKSTDEPDALMRHLIDDIIGEEIDTDGIAHLTKVAWRAMALLERRLENETKY